jgi:hypothetical protein
MYAVHSPPVLTKTGVCVVVPNGTFNATAAALRAGPWCIDASAIGQVAVPYIAGFIIKTAINICMKSMQTSRYAAMRAWQGWSLPQRGEPKHDNWGPRDTP